MNDFTVLVLPGTYASALTLTLDIFSDAALLAPKFGATPGRQVVSTESLVQLDHGMTINTQRLRKTARVENNCCGIPYV